MLLMLLAGCGEPPALQAPPDTPIHVSPNGGGDYDSLIVAVREAPAGATIRLAPGTYTLPRGIDVFRSLTIVGAGADDTIVECEEPGYVLGFESDGRLDLRYLTLRHRETPDMTNEGEPEAADVLLARRGRVVLEGCTLSGARSGRLLVKNGDDPTYERAGGAGLRALGESSLHLVGCRFEDCPLAGVAAERGVVATAVECTGLGTPGGPDKVLRLPGKRGPRNETALALYLDDELDSLIDSMNVAGAVVAVVKDGRVMYLRGAGVSDAEAGRPVDPRRTQFRLASVTKLFTTVAVLQLVDRDMLDLSAPVATLVEDVPDGPGGSRRLTVADLLTHSAGFDERWIALAARDAAAAPPLADQVRDAAPSRILAPGLVSSYSNYDMTLAGAVVEAAADQDYQSWVGERILEPLGMTHTGFEAGAAPGSEAAVSYHWAGGHRRLPPDEFASAPAAGLWSTGDDMTTFMLALLQRGRVGDVRVLTAEAANAMQVRRFANGPHLPGYAYGFAENTVQNRRVLEHTGEFNGYASILFLVPSEDLGVFVATNSERERFCREVVTRLMQHYYPDREQLDRPVPPQRLSAGLDQYVGTYRTVRHAHRTLDKWFVFSRRKDLSVVAEPGGLLYIDDTRYAQMEPLAFRELYDDSWVTFTRDSSGRIAFAYRGTTAYERLGWWETAENQRRFVILFAIVLGATAVAWTLAPLIGLLWKAPRWIRRLLRRQPFATVETRPAHVARLVAGATATIDLVSVAVIGATLTAATIRYGVPAWLTAVLTLPIIGAALTASMVGFTAVAWARGWWTVAGRLIYTFVTLVAAFFVWFTIYWNLLGFRF